jgi:hypothetical protein
MHLRPELRFLAVAVLVTAVLAAAAGGEEKIRPMTGAESPAAVLGKLQTAVDTRDRELWADCLVDSFSFTPYAGVKAAYPDLKWDEWGLARELNFVQWLLSPARKVNLDLLGDVIERGIQSRGQSEWEIVYTLVIDGTTFRGRATLRFVEIRSLWYLESWIDTRQELHGGTIAPSSGEARASIER